MSVRCLQRLNVARANLTSVNKVRPAPAKGHFSHLREQQISCQPCVAAIAVWIAMDENEPVMKPRGDFVRLVGFVVDPVTAVVKKLSQFVRYPVRVDTSDILASRSMLTGSSPDIAVHSFITSR